MKNYTDSEIQEILGAHERRQERLRKFQKFLDIMLYTFLLVGIPIGLIMLAIGIYGNLFALIWSLWLDPSQIKDLLPAMVALLPAIFVIIGAIIYGLRGKRAIKR
jgi:hypothetical protein